MNLHFDTHPYSLDMSEQKKIWQTYKCKHCGQLLKRYGIPKKWWASYCDKTDRTVHAYRVNIIEKESKS